MAKQKSNAVKLPVTVKSESRICFSVSWYANEDDANKADEYVKAHGYTYNGGYFDGMPCGREPGRDMYIDGMKLYAVTGI